MATMQEIANAAGVSKSTASRTLREDPTLSITEATRDKIFSAARAAGYQIRKDRMLSELRTIAVIHKDTHFINQLDNAFYFSLRYGIEKTCLAEKVHCGFYPESFVAQIPLQQLDGVILMGNFEQAQQLALLAPLCKKVPGVFIGKINYLQEDTDWITYDVRRCVEKALDHFCGKGLCQLLYIGGRDVPGTPPEYSKLYQFRSYLSAHPQLRCVDMIEGEHGTESGYRMAKAWFEKHPITAETGPDAIFVSNDPIAFGVLRALNELGIQIPQRVSVISINGDGPGAETAPPLTTVDIHTMDMGVEAVHCLMETMAGERKVPKKVMFSPVLRVRGSSR